MEVDNPRTVEILPGGPDEEEQGHEEGEDPDEVERHQEAGRIAEDAADAHEEEDQVAVEEETVGRGEIYMTSYQLGIGGR